MSEIPPPAEPPADEQQADHILKALRDIEASYAALRQDFNQFKQMSTPIKPDPPRKSLDSTLMRDSLFLDPKLEESNFFKDVSGRYDKM